ncbi:MAG: radical enzyme Cfr family [Solirubrobacterales bacterium]|nr:radical enzyme Cfr family [Solirubrobacterales bacterium]
MDLQLLDETLAALGQPRFRARQVWAWAARGVGGFAEMTDLPAALRERLADELPFSSLTLREEARASDGTVKALFATADERPLEAVLMRYRDGRRSICLSSQSGCPLTCTFCATGQMRFARNLTASEIVVRRCVIPTSGSRRAAASTSSRLSIGSPMPMKTAWSTGSTRRKWSAWSRISDAVKLRPNAIWPVAQNVHVSGQPDCDERQSERRTSR